MFGSMFVNTLVLLAVLGVDAPSVTDCPDGPFETDVEKIPATPLQGVLPAELRQNATGVPVEVSQIDTGGIAFFEGGLINEGKLSWYAFDVERHLFVAVLANKSKQLTPAPRPEKLSSDQLVRYSGAAGYQRVEFVTTLEAKPPQVRTFCCLANKLLASEASKVSRPTRADTLTKRFSLLHGGKTLDLNGNSKSWEVQGELERFISKPLQPLIFQAYEQ